MASVFFSYCINCQELEEVGVQIQAQSAEWPWLHQYWDGQDLRLDTLCPAPKYPGAVGEPTPGLIVELDLPWPMGRGMR